ncbi:translesion error-prone DNA polymerase V autoproteolytic subunit (plasmid) [Stutzerimonas degradans]|nr:translesion error-prone DNA polymerase V autoproteolytic subunit [Stutzerimonas degradans]
MISLTAKLSPGSLKRALPLAGPVSCGFPSPAADYAVPDLSLDELVGIRPTSSIFLFRAAGDSMLGAGIRDGDILVVDKAKEAKAGDVVLAIIGCEFTVKELAKDDQGNFFLAAANPAYRPIVLGEGETLEVWGVCIWVLHQMGTAR